MKEISHEERVSEEDKVLKRNFFSLALLLVTLE